MTFAADLTRFAEKTGLSGRVIMRKLGFQAYEFILLRSPVRTGRFRANWRIGVNRQVLEEVDAPGTTPAFEAPPSGQEEAYALGALSEVKFGDTIHITNNLPYAKPLEDGHSKQNRGGVLAPSFEELKAQLNEIVSSF